jgi:glycosyltransferase involved in cell wall biosynthesis
LKILSFSYCFPNFGNPNWGIFVYQRLAALAKAEELRVCSPVPWFPFLSGKITSLLPETELWKGLEINRPRFFYFPLILKNLDARFYARGIRKWLVDYCQNWRPDVLDVHFVWPDGVGVALLARELGLPYVITLRGKLYECLSSPSQQRQCAEALQGADKVISVSGSLAEEAEKLGVQPDHLVIIPNGVDPGLLGIRDKQACRKQLGLPEDKQILVTVAHLGHRKGHHEVIRALAGLPKDVVLVIVGGAAQGGTPEMLQQVAFEAGVENRLILPGRQPYEKIPLYFGAADVSVLASYREGCPNAVLESLACGTPVVASDVGAVRDILPVPDVGRIVPPRQAGPLETALKEVLACQWNPEDVVAKSRVKSWSEIAQKVQSVLVDLAGLKGDNLSN